MLPLRPNPETGYLESNRLSSFDSAKKVRFIELAKEAAMNKHIPNLATLSQAVGIAIRTYWDHMAKDPKFAEAWRDVEDICEANLVDCMYEYAQRPSNYMDRITWLRAKRPERWHPEFKVTISQDSAYTKGLVDMVKGAIDADIVDELKSIEGVPPTSSLQDNQTD